MTELLEIRRPTDTDAEPRSLMTCDVPVVTPRRPRAVEVPAPACRPSGRSPHTHRRGGVSNIEERADVRTRPARSVVRSAERSNDAVFVRRRAWALGLLAGIGLAAVVAVLGVVGNDYENAATGAPAATQVVHVRTGESLTSLAERVAPGRSVAAVVEVVRELNDLQTVGLRPGQALVVPDYR